MFNSCIDDLFAKDPDANICGPCGCKGCPLVKPAPGTTDEKAYCISSKSAKIHNECIDKKFSEDPTQNICGPCGCPGCPLAKPQHTLVKLLKNQRLISDGLLLHSNDLLSGRLSDVAQPGTSLAKLNLMMKKLTMGQKLAENNMKASAGEGNPPHSHHLGDTGEL